MSEVWWRSWHGAPMDHKWSVIAARTGIKTGIVSAIAWELLDFASQNENRGSIEGFDIETYSVYSGFSEDEISAVINAMTDKGIIKNSRFVNWEKRQPKSETESERVKKYRQNKKSTVTECYDSLHDVTDCYGMLRNVTECYDSVRDVTQDTDTDKELKDCDSQKNESRAEEIEYIPFDESCEEKWDEVIKEDATPEKKIKEHKPPASAEKKREMPTDPTYWDFLGVNKELGIAFYRASKLTPVKSEFGKWVKGFKELAEAGITPEEIPRVIEEMRKQRLTIKAPQSILAIGRDLKAKKEANNELDGWTLR